MGFHKLYTYNSANAFAYQGKLYFITEDKEALQIATYDDKLKLLDKKEIKEANGQICKLIIEKSAPLITQVPQNYPNTPQIVEKGTELMTDQCTTLSARLPWISSSGRLSMDIDWEYIQSSNVDNIAIFFKFDGVMIHKILNKFESNIYLEILEQDDCAILVLSNDLNSKTVIYEIHAASQADHCDFRCFHYNNGVPNEGFRNEKGRFTHYLRSTFITNDYKPVRYPELAGKFIVPSNDFKSSENLKIYKIIDENSEKLYLFRENQIFSIKKENLQNFPEKIESFENFELKFFREKIFLKKNEKIFFISKISDFLENNQKIPENSSFYHKIAFLDEWGVSFEEILTGKVDSENYFVYLLHRKKGKNLLIMPQNVMKSFEKVFIFRDEPFSSRKIMVQKLSDFETEKWSDLSEKQDIHSFPQLIRYWQVVIKDHILYKLGSNQEIERYFVPGLRDHNNLDDDSHYHIFTISGFLSSKSSSGKLQELGIRVY